MALIILLIEIFILFCLTSLVLNKYGNWKRQRIAVTLATLFAWYFSFIIISILPLDVSMTTYYQCIAKFNVSTVTGNIFNQTHNASITNETLYQSLYDSCQKPWNVIPKSVLVILWRIVYWTSQVLTWLIIPMMQSYAKAGNFTIFGKIKTALYENLIWYGTYLTIFIAICIYIGLKPHLQINTSQLLLIISSASNTWGLILLVLLLGYGLIQIPRSVWYYSAFVAGGIRARLERSFYKAAIIYPLKQEVHVNLEDVIEEIQRINYSMPASHPLRRKLAILINKIPSCYKDRCNFDDNHGGENRKTSINKSSTQRIIDMDLPTAKELIALHKSLIAVLIAYERTSMQWQSVLESVSFIVKNYSLDSTHFTSSNGTISYGNDLDDLWKYAVYYGQEVNNNTKSTILPAIATNSGVDSDLTDLSNTSIYCCGTNCFYRTWIHVKIGFCKINGCMKPWLYKGLALFFCLLSISLIWSELFLFKRTQPVLSLFAILLQEAKKHLHNYIFVEIVSIITLTYISLCAYFTVFRLRIFDLYCLLPNHHTDEYSLLFSAMLISRLTSPLCLNFLGLIHMDQGYTVSYKNLNYLVSQQYQSSTDHHGSTILDTAFIQVMGRLSLIPIIGQGFNVYFPMLIALLCVIHYFDLVGKFGHSIGYSKFTTGDFNRYYSVASGNRKTCILCSSLCCNRKHNNTADIIEENMKHSRIKSMVEEGKILVKREFRNLYLESHNYRDLSGNNKAPTRNSLNENNGYDHQQQTYEERMQEKTYQTIMRKKYSAIGNSLSDNTDPNQNPNGNNKHLSYNSPNAILQHSSSRDQLLPKGGGEKDSLDMIKDFFQDKIPKDININTEEIINKAKEGFKKASLFSSQTFSGIKDFLATPSGSGGISVTENKKFEQQKPFYSHQRNDLANNLDNSSSILNAKHGEQPPRNLFEDV